jgi:hypothetical protein
VQMMSAVRTMQAVGMTNSCYKQHRARPCKNRKSGAPSVPEREREMQKGRATRQHHLCNTPSPRKRATSPPTPNPRWEVWNTPPTVSRLMGEAS